MSQIFKLGRKAGEGKYALLEVKQRKDLGNFPDMRGIIFEKFVFMESHEYGQNTKYLAPLLSDPRVMMFG